MILQNFLFPKNVTTNEELLYVRHNGNAESYDTYFNAFSIAKWKLYTGIKEYYLEIKTTGNGIVVLSNEEGELISRKINGEATIRIPETDASMLYVVWNPHNESKIISAAFATDETAKRDIRIAINTCTFKREDYIKRNVDILKREIVEHKGSLLYDKCFIYVIDNGRTIDASEIDSQHVKIYHNINAGGSGGYTRGLLEILNDKNDRKLTNVIFMDDDVVVQPESIYRTFSLLSYLKDEYKDSVIAGAMLRNELRYIQHECGARWNGISADSCNAEIDLRDFCEVFRNEKTYECDYASWWYACYSLNVVRDDNLPMPFFIKADDIEYGMRNKSKILMVNGICIWHESFETKRNETLNYYNIRNQAITNVSADRSTRKKIYKLCFKSILGNALRYRYDDNQIVERAVRDILKGPKYLSNTDPVKLNQEIRKLGCKMERMHDRASIETRKKNISKLKQICTMYGWLLPADYSKEYCVDIYADPSDLYRRGKLRLVSLEAGHEYHGEKSYKQGLKALGLMIKLEINLLCNYERVCKEYRDSKRYLTSREFWEKYLKLK